MTRDPNITPLGFTCFRLVRLYDVEPDALPFSPIELHYTRNAMFAFVARR